jgi:hypothetical protein
MVEDRRPEGQKAAVCDREGKGAKLILLSEMHSHGIRINPFMKTEPLWLNHLLKVPPVNTVALGIKFPTHKLQGT